MIRDFFIQLDVLYPLTKIVPSTPCIVRVHTCVCINVCVRSRAHALAPHWERKGQAHVGARGQIRGAIV